jgi:hypothetical protein
MRLRLFAACFAIAVAGAFAATSCGDDSDDCAGTILNSCSDCECPTGKQTTCTAYPKGDTNSRERCCVCE